MEEWIVEEDYQPTLEIIRNLNMIKGSYEGLSEIKERVQEIHDLISSKIFKRILENENLIQHFIDQIREEAICEQGFTEEELIKETIEEVKKELRLIEEEELLYSGMIPFFAMYVAFFNHWKS